MPKKGPSTSIRADCGAVKIVSEETRDCAVSRSEILQATGPISHLGDAKNALMRFCCFGYFELAWRFFSTVNTSLRLISASASKTSM